MNDRGKRGLSFAVFGLGMLIGLVGCALLPMATFTVGVNDSEPEVWALILIFGAPFPLSLLALWKRFLAGILSICVALFIPFAMEYQRWYMITVRHFPNQESILATLGDLARYYCAFLALGIFAIATEQLGWPKLISYKQQPLH